MLQQVFVFLDFVLVTATENWLNDINRKGPLDDNFRKSHPFKEQKNNVAFIEKRDHKMVKYLIFSVT